MNTRAPIPECYGPNSISGSTILLHIRAQNAGVMIRRVDRLIHVEAFELCPLNEPVLTTKGRLRRSFPGAAVALSANVFENPSFQETAALTLARMSHQPAVETKPKSTKAGRMHDESRDTTHPKMVTELFMGFLTAIGAPVNVSRLLKNTREEVMWLDTLLPWRRSPVWMLLRVAMQLTFSRLAGSENISAGYYKVFMIFLMANVLRRSVQFRLPCDLLYAMNAKLGRRLLKLSSFAPRAGIAAVQNIMRETAKHIRTRWESVMRGSSPHHDLSILRNLDFGHDAFAPVDGLAAFVNDLSALQDRTHADFFHPSSVLARYRADNLPTIPSGSDEYAFYNLKAFETWIASCLPQWLKQHMGDVATCGKLGALIVKYFQTASPQYSKNPESFSVLLLTIIELWIACDQSALHQCNFLQDYDPGIPAEVLQGLILPFECQMQRLLRAEAYLRRRQSVAHHLSPSIFRDYGQSSCFAVRYFDQSSEHQRIHDDVVISATQTRDAKVQELRQKKEEYSRLMQLYEQNSCQYYEVVVDYENDFREQRHSDSCARCSYKSQADRISIDVYEWPLPQKDLDAKSTVFELRVPQFFSHWRDTALFLLVEILRSDSPSACGPQARYPLKDYNGLSNFFVPHNSGQRLILLSEIKPHGRTHWRNKRINVIKESDVCPRNGLRYRYFDDVAHTFIDDFQIRDTISSLLTYQLPESSSSLQQFLSRPSSAPSGPSPNTVIASQFDCPTHISLDEYKALCSIPLGYHIQWQNILLQLAMPSVDFKQVETSLVILQSIYQAGPHQDGTLLRASHQVLMDGNFASALLRGLEESLERVRENWESSQAFSTFVSVSVRLLSLTSEKDIETRCLAYIRDLRAVTFGWVKLLTDKAHVASDDSQRAELLFHAAELALICADTFNADDKYLQDALTLPQDSSVFLQCCILIHNSASVISGNTDPMTPILHQRWKSLCYRGYPVLSTRICDVGSQCLDDAIRLTWSSYVIGDGWRAVSPEFDYWLVNTLSPHCSDRTVAVHYNLLTGELLIDGLPLARLPRKYRTHPMHRTLFGLSDLEVTPSSLPGMRFSVKRDHAGYTVHLNMRPTSNLLHPGHDFLVRAIRDGRTYDLIPPRFLLGKFPVHFTADFVHWYSAEDECVEFRPINDPWSSSPNNWRLTRDANHHRWRLVKGGLSLISVTSETARVICGIISPLESPLHIHSVLQSSSILEIELPRLSLAFFLKLGTSLFQSKQFRGLAIDPDQSLDTLVGLRNKLMLRNDATGQRSVILPEGRLAYQRSGDHVNVTIDHDTTVKIHAYRVDNQLGRLLDNGTLQSKLWLCYLHATTSFCLIDPLIQRTGTEQALSILGSAAVRSFDRLHQGNTDVLHRIARLTPGRGYYPSHERVMQVVKWAPELSFLSQHGGFYSGVQLVLDQAEKTRVFYPESYVKPPILDHVKPDLLDRDRIRSSTFCVSEFGAEHHTINQDTIYGARDQGRNSLQASRAFIMSSLVFHEYQSVHYPFKRGWSDRVWQFLARKSLISGPHQALPSLRYDAGLLQDWAQTVAKHWCALHQSLSRTSASINKFALMIWLSTVAFAKDCDMEVVQSIGAFSVLSGLTHISPPAVASFQLSEGAVCHHKELRSSLKAALRSFAKCAVSQLTRGYGESQHAFKQRQQRLFQSDQDRTVNQFVQTLSKQWPCENPTLPRDNEFSNYLYTTRAMDIVRPKFKTWYDNYQLKQYLDRVGDALQDVRVTLVTTPQLSSTGSTMIGDGGRAFVCVDDIFAVSPPLMRSHQPDILTDNILVPTNTTDSPPRLSSLLDHLKTLASSSAELDYVDDLRASLRSFQSWDKQYRLPSDTEGITSIFCNARSCSKDLVQQVYDEIVLAATTVDNATTVPSSDQRYRQNLLRVLEDIGQYPRLCPIFFLQQLGRHRWPKITSEWRHCVVRYARALADLQRVERLVSLSGSKVDLIKELCNRGHTNWDPIDHPESLLLEVESGILIRDVQEEIAGQMRNVAENSTMQLNMGEGKSSVIIPVVAAALADRTRLVRIVTAKPQAKQMLQMLVSKLGGMLDRQVYHMPFSRSVQLETEDAATIGEMCRKCMMNGDVLLVQPEHILSFKLMGLECLITGKGSIGRSLLDTQEFFNVSSRDIVDESDDNFSVKFELIYTMGMQQPIELSPRRWTCIQQVLELVRKFAPGVALELPASMEIYAGSAGSFPRTRILDDDGQRQVSTLVARYICEHGLDGFPISRQPTPIRDAIFRYLTESSPSRYEIARVESQEPGGFWTAATSKTLLLLRGLLAGAILSFAFRQKRWRVQYGLDTRRRPLTKLAVPYRAKDSPTLRSEFSHPDVVIVLTCLSHYYGGLTDDDMFRVFDHLLKSYQADIEYQEWVKDAPELPTGFRQLSGINLKDRVQCVEQLFPPLRYAKNAIDYFLARLIFPKEMREFPHKLSASGWDIGQIKGLPTSGFSGTNDSRMTLPLVMTHLDLSEQKHTNALVLEHLLQPENLVMPIPARVENQSSTAEILLDMVTKMKPPAQVILDVGAQILELSNWEVAREWLERTRDHGQAQAVVFFNEDDELSVLDRTGHVECLQTSHFADQLDVCLVFLDEAHTRGTDLKLPEYYKAAVTLGANLTKDRLVQGKFYEVAFAIFTNLFKACMRMRKLGHGQSVVFCVPEEVERRISSWREISDCKHTGVPEVLCWAITETWADIRRSMPLWAAQGRRFEFQHGLWADARTDGELRISQLNAERFLEDESQSLERRYRPCVTADTLGPISTDPNANLQRIAERLLDFHSLEHNTAALREEQERELSPEIVQEREVQRPALAEPEKHRIHPDLKKFVIDGILRSNSGAFNPAFETLRRTSAAAHIDVSQFPTDVLTTVDFASTVHPHFQQTLLDAYQRSVQWILTSIGSNNTINHMIIISPFEAQVLLPDIQESRRVTLHLYAPRTNLGFRPIDALDLYSVSGMLATPTLPPQFTIQLNLFAGQLYLDSFDKYIEVCNILGLAWQKAEDRSQIAADGFIIRDCHGQVNPLSSFSESPVMFLHVLMTKIRKSCEEIEKTDMGAVLGGRLLASSDFELRIS